MFETKYSKFLTILLIIIIVAVLGLIGYLGYSYYKEYSMKKEADSYVSNFSEEASGNNTNTNIDITNETITGNITSAEVDSNSTMVQTYKGYEIIGTIEIPKIDVNYPVYQTPPTPKKLELSIAAVYPMDAKFNTIGNVVLLGHNYRNGSFFSNLKKLEEGDKIYITDVNKVRKTYSVYSTFTATKDETSFYNRDTDGKMEITLSTCADDSTTERVIVEARAD